MTPPVLFKIKLSLLLFETSPAVTLVATCHVKLLVGVRGGVGGLVGGTGVLVGGTAVLVGGTGVLFGEEVLFGWVIGVVLF